MPKTITKAAAMAVALLVAIAIAATGLAGSVGGRLKSRWRRDESGQLVEWLALGLLGLLAVVAIYALLRALGLDIIAEMRDQLGL
ncbi:MAG: hypothetical protein ACRDZW_07350 [Acidimicrobiales bacterium]